MSRRDLSAFFDTGIDYPGIPSTQHPDGKDYHVASPNAKNGLWLASLADLGMKSAAGGELVEEDLAQLDMDDDGEKEFRRRVLGPVFDELIEDGVAWELVKVITNDAFVYFARDRELADQLLAHQGEEVARANRAIRRKAQRTTSRTAKKTAGSKSSRASTGTPAQTRGQGSTPSSTSPSEPKAAEAV